jgi:hypothetical protein
VRLLALVLLFAPLAHDGDRWRRPTPPERVAIVRDVKASWRTDNAFAALRARGLHAAISDIRISGRDRHFVSVALHPLNRGRRQLSETATLVLMQAIGHWLLVIGPLTDAAGVCQAPAPLPIRDLLCR